jgi:acetyl/propionyl-CoA carboxylase alpha subunit
VGIATFELLVDPDGEIFFLGATSSLGEMHAVTDLLLGIDTAELEMRVAAGEALAGPPRFVSGHAFEARIDAVDTSVGDAVADGTLEGATFPPAPTGKIRIDLVAGAGATFDAAHTVVARVTTQAAVRHLALLALDRMLAETAVAGPATTNVAWLRKVLGHESFRAGQYDRTFCDRV